jgi:protein gp37
MLNLTDIDWVIVGGESGPHARPMQTQWAMDVRNQCLKAKVAFFFSSNGAAAHPNPADACLKEKNGINFPRRYRHHPVNLSCWPAHDRPSFQVRCDRRTDRRAS